MNENERSQFIPPHPVPFTFTADIAELPDGKKAVVVMFTHATGSTVFFMEPSAAQKCGQALEKISRQAKTNLILAKDLP